MKRILLLTVITLGFAVTNTISAQVKKTTASKTVKSSSQKKAPVGVKKPTPKPIVKIAPVDDTSTRVRIVTDSGTLIVKLYDSTPLHRDNFVKLVNEGFFDSLMFHRVIPGFMIQGGDPLSKNAPSGTMLGNGGGDMERIPAEFRKSLIHKVGALAAARDGNPEKASSACQFYLVDGKKITDQELDMMEARLDMKYTPEQRAIYKTQGGTPMLDQNYTVFGEVERGLEVIRKIANVPRDGNNRPHGDVRMSISILK